MQKEKLETNDSKQNLESKPLGWDAGFRAQNSKNLESSNNHFKQSKIYILESKDSKNTESTKNTDSINKDSATTCHVELSETSSIESKDFKIDSNDIDFKTDSKDGKIKTLTRSANDLSLGISMIVAVLLGLGIGYLLYKWLGYYWLIWVGLSYGVAAAILNVVKAYKRLYKDLDSLKHEEKYKYMQDRILEKREREAMQRKEKKDT